MSESPTPLEPDSPAPLEPRPEFPRVTGRFRRGLSIGGLVSWLVVGLLTLILTTLVLVGQLTQQGELGGDASPGDLMAFQIQARALVGQRQLPKFLGMGMASDVQLPEELDQGCYEQRLGYAILTNEFAGAAAAQSYLGELDRKVEQHQLPLTDRQRELRGTLDQLLTGYGKQEFQADQIITPAQRGSLVDHLGFVGQLALVPPGTSEAAARQSLVDRCARTMLGMGLALLAGLMAGLAGVLLSVFFIGQLVLGSLRSRWRESPADANVYIETFAIWLSLFFFSSLFLGLLDLAPETAMLVQPFIFFGSLISVAWPVMRGLPWRQVREDIGWSASRPWLEIATAPLSYLATLPWLLPGILLAAFLATALGSFAESHEFSRQLTPSHPVQEFIASGDWAMLLLVFLTASVAAPIVEETMFRGVLYRHLRQQLPVVSRTASVLLSALINGFIFASIHPQGLAGIPVLMTLAVGFSLAREWRGNLVNPMVMHGIHNTLITLFTVLIL